MKKQPARDEIQQLQQPGRRTVIKTAVAGAAAVAFPFVWTPSRAANKRIVIRDDGGIYTKY
jgi:putative spermidine/putrescine transport system substrate-binding protein